MRTHVQILGILNVVWGALGLVGALVVLVIFGGVVGIVGAVAHQEPAAGIAIPILSLVGGFILIVVVVTSIPSVIAGIGLLKYAGWGRVVGIVVSVLHLFNLPFGTALGIYGLWVLLTRETESLFEPARPAVRI